jgi:hypothetical protein
MSASEKAVELRDVRVEDGGVEKLVERLSSNVCGLESVALKASEILFKLKE